MFNSIEFNKSWLEWKQHKSEKHGMPYTQVAERKALASLYKMCDGREELAIASIDHSIECNWSKIYLKKDFINGNGQNNGGGQPNNQKRGTSTDRMEAARNW